MTTLPTLTPGQAPQQVLKAEAVTPDATDRGVPANSSPVGGPMGAGQPAAAGPVGGMQAPPWTYEPPFGRDVGLAVMYRKVDLMASVGDVGLALRRNPSAVRASLQFTVYLPHGTLHQEVYLTPQRAIALRNALNDFLADVRKEAQA